MEARGRGRNTKAINPQQASFELKKKVLTALNKLADRDTYQIGLHELEQTVENLPQDKIASFLSCILDTDSDQKTAVRKECVRLIAALAAFHEPRLVATHLCKMVSSVIKRLKDPDSAVRDACVETMGVLASKIIGDDDSRGFVSLAKPLFEAIGDQNNKYVQSGAALCLAGVINNSRNAPVAIIQRMLMRTVKLLNNSHCIAKPAIIVLNTSIILQVGGAVSKSVLVSAVSSVQNALKSNDWNTRKAASVALMDIAATGEKFLGSLKASCISSLESCRFDKVKPVRDSVLLALQYWKGVSGGSDSPVLSETVKEESSELFSTGDSDTTTTNKHVTDFARIKVPFSARKAPIRYNDEPRKTKKENWDIEIAVPESESSCITKTVTPELTYEYIVPEDESIAVSSSSLVNPACYVKDRSSLDSVVTVSSSSGVNHGDYVAEIANEMASVHKKLSDIENKQSLLIDQIQAFSAGILNNFSVLQSKVLSLEYAVEKLAQGGSSTLTPRLSSCTLRKSRVNESHKTRSSNPSGQQRGSEDIWNNVGQAMIQNRESCDSSRSIRQHYGEAMSRMMK